MNSGIMQNMRYQIAVIFAALLILASCAQMTPNGSDISTQAVQLTPYRTATATATITPTPPDAPTSTLAPTITPTPRVYTVKANDTLIDIAYLNGLTLDELKAANPDVNPYNLAIGTKLLIPAAKPAEHAGCAQPHAGTHSSESDQLHAVFDRRALLLCSD